MLVRLFTEPQQGADYDTLLRVARTVEDCGFDGFFRSDHYLAYGGGDGLPGPSHSWVTLAGLARDTSRIRLGTLMTSATFQLPGPLAVAVANVDVMSGGRVELGIGAGWYEPEHAAYGIPFPPTGERFDRFEEQLAIITGLWATPVGERYSFTGKHYTLVDSPALPKPYAGPPPVIIGGYGAKRTPQLAATYADEFNYNFRSVEESAAAFERVRELAVAQGREPAYSVAQEVACGKDDATVARRRAVFGRPEGVVETNGLVGSPSQIVDKLGRLAEIGASRVYLRVLDLDDLEHLELIGSEVIPQLA